jgi:hypothetical protein
MKASGLRDCLADAMQVDPSKVWVTMRNLRENDLLTTGARGMHAPHMTYRDAARVLIAHILNPNPGRDAPRLVRRFGALPCANPAIFDDPAPFSLRAILPDQPIETLEDATAALIEIFAEHDKTTGFEAASRNYYSAQPLKPECRIEIFEEDDFAIIRMAGLPYAFEGPPVNARDWTPSQDERLRLGRQAKCFVNDQVIDRIAQSFKTVEEAQQ